MQHRPAVMACIAAMSTGCSSPVFFWDVPVRSPLPTSQNPADVNGITVDVAPETMCALVRKGAIEHRDADLTLGVVLSALGGTALASGMALAAQQGHSPEYVGSWSAVAGLGTFGVAAGIYFLIKSGSDREEYWLANAAVAQINADYAQYPSVAPQYLHGAIDAYQKARAAADAQPHDDKLAVLAKAQEQAFQAIRAQDQKWLATPEAHVQAVDDAAGLRKKATQLAAVATAEQATTSIRDTELAAALSAYQKYLQTPPPKPAADDTGKLIPAPPPGAPVPNPAVDSLKAAYELALKLDEEAHSAASKAAADAATASSEAADMMNVLLRQQAAWSDCAKALLAIGGVDSAAATAFAAALGGSKGGGGAGSGAAGSASGATSGH